MTRVEVPAVNVPALEPQLPEQVMIDALAFMIPLTPIVIVLAERA
jgi:hypothetical protein